MRTEPPTIRFGLFLVAPRTNTLAAAAIFLLMCVAPAAGQCRADDAGWSEFRGGDGRVDRGSLPAPWTDADYAWQVDLGSRDVGSMVVFGHQVFLLRRDTANGLLCLDCLDLTTGSRIWSKANKQVVGHLHQRNTAASSTPAVDQRHVYVAYAEPDHTWLVAYDHEGNEVWRRDFGRWVSQHGFGASPKVVDDMVVLLNSQQAQQLGPGETPGNSRLIAVDRETGADIWQTALQATRSCYGVPGIVRDESGRVTQLIGANTGNGLFAVDPKSGQLLWNVPVFDQRVCSSPLVHGDLVIGTCGSGGGGNELVAVRFDPQQPDQTAQEVYRLTRSAPYVPTPVIKDDLLFAIDDRGIATCHDVATGQNIWRERIGGNFGASPIIVGSQMLIIDLAGNATILSATRQPAIIAEIDLGGPVGATPVVANDRLLIRIGNRLVCLECGNQT